MTAPAAELLAEADRVMGLREPVRVDGPLRVGVDLGTAFIVVMVTDADGQPVAGATRFAQVVRDGVVVDFTGAADVLRQLKAEVEQRLGRELTGAATTYPPGVPVAEVRATRYVLEAVGLECTNLVDEHTAANAVLGLSDAVVVDIGGGTTGLAVIEEGEVVYTADEPTGGTHLSLVLAGHFGIPVDEAELRKRDPDEQPALFPIVRPVMEKIGSIIARHLEGRPPAPVHLVGGTSAFPGIEDVIADVIGRPTVRAPHPLLVTPLGVALHDPLDPLGSSDG